MYLEDLVIRQIDSKYYDIEDIKEKIKTLKKISLKSKTQTTILKEIILEQEDRLNRSYSLIITYSNHIRDIEKLLVAELISNKRMLEG